MWKFIKYVGNSKVKFVGFILVLAYLLVTYGAFFKDGKVAETCLALFKSYSATILTFAVIIFGGKYLKND